MALTLITGRAHAGKSRFIGETIEDACRAGLVPTLLLPTAPDSHRAIAEFAERGLVGVWVGTFELWMDDLWLVHGDGRRLIGGNTRLSLIRKILERARPELLVGRPGLAEMLADIAISVAVRESLSPAGRLAHEIHELIKEYKTACTGLGLVERGEAARVLSETITTLEGPLVLNRFTGLTAAQELLVTALAVRNEVSVALPWEEGFPASEALDPLVGRLGTIAKVHHRVACPARRSELEILEDRLFRPGEPIPSAESLVLAEAGGPEAEIALAADLALEAVSEGIDPERVAVVFRRGEARAAALSAALASRNLLADIDVSYRFEATGFGRAFLSLLEAVGTATGTREPLMGYAASPYCRLSGPDLGSLDVLWRRRRLDGDALLGSVLDAADETTRHVLSLARQICREGPDAENTGVSVVEIANRLLAQVESRTGLESHEGRVDAAAHCTLIEVVDQLLDAGGGISQSALVAALRSTRVAPGGGNESGAVQITEAHRLQSRRFDIVIVGGLSAAEFSSEGIEPASERLLRELGAGESVDSRLTERLLFYSVATRPRRRLVLLRQSSDSSGAPVRPSVFWDEVVDAYSGVKEHEPGGGAIPGLRRVRLGMWDMERVVSSYERTGPHPQVVSEPPFRPERGVLDEATASLLEAEREFSVSELEVYLKCPYLWFVGYAVSPQEIDRLLDVRERGRRAHAILARFYRRWHEEQGSLRVTEESMGSARALIERLAAEVAEEADIDALGMEEELACAVATRWAQNIVNDDVSFLPEYVPVEHEWRFGTVAGRPVEFAGIPVAGSIDRLDTGPAGILVTDYKSSTDLKGGEGLLSHSLLQLPMYASVASDLLGVPVAGGLYRSMKSLKVRGFWLEGELESGRRGCSADAMSADGIRELIASAGEMARHAVDGIRAGRIERRGSVEGCRYCVLSGSCPEAVIV